MGVPINAKHLYGLVKQEATADKPVLVSAEVKRLCGLLQMDWGEIDRSRKGRPLEKADHAACGQGLLQKWKKRGAHNAPIGWCLSDDASVNGAERWAAKHGWMRVD